MCPNETNNNAVYWLIIMTSIISFMSALLYLFQRCCGQFWANIGNVCYQKCTKSLELSLISSQPFQTLSMSITICFVHASS